MGKKGLWKSGIKAYRSSSLNETPDGLIKEEDDDERWTSIDNIDHK